MRILLACQIRSGGTEDPSGPFPCSQTSQVLGVFVTAVHHVSFVVGDLRGGWSQVLAVLLAVGRSIEGFPVAMPGIGIGSRNARWLDDFDGWERGVKGGGAGRRGLSRTSNSVRRPGPVLFPERRLRIGSARAEISRYAGPFRSCVGANGLGGSSFGQCKSARGERETEGCIRSGTKARQ